MRVKHPYINECALETTAPQCTDTDIETCLVLGDCCAVAKSLTGGCKLGSMATLLFFYSTMA